MLKFVTSLGFLYLFAIAVLFMYSICHYRRFARQQNRHRRFSLIFSLIGIACLGFLWININAPLSLKTFSNLDHHFLRHDGFRAKDSIALGMSDTTAGSHVSFSRFLFSKQGDSIVARSSYAEEPFYAGENGRYRLLSKSFAAEGKALRFTVSGKQVEIKALPGNVFELSTEGAVASVTRAIRKGIAAWDLFRDNESFINSGLHANENITNSLRHIYLLRNEPSVKESSELKFFLSARLFNYAENLKYGDENIKPALLHFSAALHSGTAVAWGIGFSSGNNNRYRIYKNDDETLSLLAMYPRSYPMTEENRDDWSSRRVSKFLVSSTKDLLQMPAVFREGFMFNSQHGDSSLNFSPLLLTYNKAAKDDPLQMTVQPLASSGTTAVMEESRLFVPSASKNIDWLFSVQNTYNWQLGNRSIDSSAWQLLIFGSLGFFILLVFFTSLLKREEPLSWIWQLLSSITLLLLTTRFFLYWRYKSFPPYEGMDLPSIQQLNSTWNFGIIILATLLLAVILGFGFLKHLYNHLGKFFRLQGMQKTNVLFHPVEYLNKAMHKIPVVKNMTPVVLFFFSWFLLLLLSGAMAAFTSYDPATCRHLAIGLIMAWFIFTFISYKHSPLSASTEKSWWNIDTGKATDIIVSNPVKVLLSVSLLALFAFIDIGFAIVFLNFLLFNEAFLCINYAIAGLSAGSRRNAALFSFMGLFYLGAFFINLLFAPYIFSYLLNLSDSFYAAAYLVFALLLSWHLLRLLPLMQPGKRKLIGAAAVASFFLLAFFFFPKEKIMAKASMTKYRIDVLVKPPDKVIESAYSDGKTYEPVIRAAQNQWFINTFIHDDNNPVVNQNGFHLLPHAPQHKGAKYNAQATDLVASRFIIAEHGKWPVLLFVLLLLLPATMLASFYKLYPDFTNRINSHYPVITTGFSILNYLALTALLVTLAATGRYIFFGQDLPFASILSKQSVLFPAILIIAAVLLFRKIPLEHYANRKKQAPGFILFAGLAILLFLVKPAFNKNREFGIAGMGKDMDSFVQQYLQPLMNHIDTAANSRKLSFAAKDRLFCDSLRNMIEAGYLEGENKFFASEAMNYARSGFDRHVNDSRLIWLDLYNGSPQLAVNHNYFRVDPPPHLQQSWKGNLYGDSSVYNIAAWNVKDGSLIRKRLTGHSHEPYVMLDGNWQLSFRSKIAEHLYENLYLVNKGNSAAQLIQDGKKIMLNVNDSLLLPNPCWLEIEGADGKTEQVISSRPDALMANFYVNGGRSYVYPLAERFVWARNFAESIAADHADEENIRKDIFVSLDVEMMDSLSQKLQQMMLKDTAYHKGAEYGICIADGNGRIIAMNDFIKGLERPDPNDKSRFNKVIRGEGGYVSQSLLRKQTGNVNLLRLNPGPGSTLKPVVFAAVASQMDMDWDAFASDGFSTPQRYFGGERVAEYDFEKNNGRISRVTDYLRLSDNYYHSNVLLLGSYEKQQPAGLLSKHFTAKHPSSGLHWPSFSYKGKQYWLEKFNHWPGYAGGKASFGSDSSFISVGLLSNFGIHTRRAERGFELFSSRYDSLLFGKAWRRSGFILPEYALFDQRAEGFDHRIPYDLFTMGFRGHVKGSSQVMIPPLKMLEAFGKLVSQSRNYGLTLNPYAPEAVFSPFYVDNNIAYASYLMLVREHIFAGMREALFKGTAARLGTFLKNGAPYHYYAKTGTTGDNESTTKSKLLALVISSKDVAAPGHNFRNNKFVTVYFTSQNGPVKQNEEFQAEVITYIQESRTFKKYMLAK